MNKIFRAVEKHQEMILSAEKFIWEHAEAGYKEYETNAFLIEKMQNLGYTVTRAEHITGFYTVIDTGREGPTVLLLAELDALYCPSHPETNPKTGCVHACGHNSQCAALLGVAAALSDKEITDGLCGRIKICFVPAEEGIDIDFRQKLIENHVIDFTEGKAEFFSRGYFDDVDLAFMVHAEKIRDDGKKFVFIKGCNGFLRKKIRIKGVAAHAGEAPHLGINALNAAALCINAVNNLRETFKEEDVVRIHGIITRGGSSVNVVPDDVELEYYVRAANVSAMKYINELVNRTVSGICTSFGAEAEIADYAGCEPLNNDKNLTLAAEKAVTENFGENSFVCSDEWKASSTDMGDVSTVLPALHAYICCYSGTQHGKDYIIPNPGSAVESAEFQLGLLIHLLENKESAAPDSRKIIDEYSPVFQSIEDYLHYKRSLDKKIVPISYKDDGTITIDYK